MPDTVGIPIDEGFFCLDGSWRFTFVNRITLEVLGRTQEEIQGKVIWEEIPSLVGSTFEQTCRNVLERRSASRVEIRSGESGIYYHLVVFPSPGTDGVAVYWRDVTAEMQARETLETLVKKLKMEDESRIGFINTLSHELRNPLAAISLGLTLLKEAPAGSEQSEKAISIMERQTSQLSRLVEDLLDVTRIAQKKIELKKERIDLNEVVYHTVLDFQPLFAEKDIQLDFELNPEIISMNADRSRLTQAVGNLLQNSVKFTCKGGITRVTVILEEGDVCQALIIVRDNGLGIEPSLLPELFEPFVQGDSTLAHSVGGLGLGLPIVKGIAALHGGSISVESDGIGKGTRAVIRLPLSDGIEKNDEEGCVTEEEICGRTLRILIIEDNADLAEILSELLTHLGHNVTTALNGQEGLRMARHHRPDVLISDIGLPGMSGYELAEEIRNDNQLKGIYLIALSGYAQPEDFERSNKAGFKSHLAKPVNLESLKTALREAERGTFEQ